MRRLLFLLPLLLLIGIPWLILHRSGEWMPAVAVVREATSRPIDDDAFRYWPAFRHQAAAFKLELIRQHGPVQVLALGTSRTAVIRGTWLKPATFVNAGFGITSLADVRPFLERSPQLPKVLILGLDQNFFHAGWQRRHLAVIPPALEDPAADQVVFNHWPEVWKGLAQQRFDPFIAAGDRIGLAAINRLGGYRIDGSTAYERQGAPPRPWQQVPLDERLKEARQRIASGGDKFETGTAPDPDMLKELDRVATWCDVKGIVIAGFLPPFAHSIWAEMHDPAKGGAYAYLDRLPAEVSIILGRHGGCLVDASDLAELGLGDEHAMDGYHADEDAYAILVGRLVAACPTLAGMVAAGSRP
ncbi:hypothetical protein LBMAG53_14760 [Planctomycetota bacterium]|nr:hypothetical protein LBMAG53_14760 [Planctomycetota bacterium]